MSNPSQSLKALILAAVSTLEQADKDKFSLDAQIADANALAEKNGWHIIDTIRIEGHSRNYRTLAQLAAAARANNEPGFDRLIAHLEASDFDILICRDANRFARKASLLYEIVDTILEDCGARIYSLSDGWVNADNADMWLMVKGYEIRKQMHWIQHEMVRGRYKLVDDHGLPQGSQYVWSHMKVRDEKGKVLAFVPDPAKTHVIEAAAQLVVDRVGWRDLEQHLFEQGYGDNGKPFKRYFFYHIFTNPWFWGDAVRNHKNVKLANGQKIGLWCVDVAAPVPEGVVIRRGVNPPAITGDLAIRLRAEVIRRISFRPRRHADVRMFSGLLVCKKCGFMMVFSHSSHSDGYNCQSKYNSRAQYNATLRPGCERKWWISERKVKQWINHALEIMLEQHDPFYLVAPDTEIAPSHLEQLQSDLAALEKQIRRAIEKQMAAPDSLANIYDEQIAGLAAQRDNLLTRIDEDTRLSKRYNLDDVQAAYRELTTYETLEVFWAAPNGVINQLLHRLMGGRRLTVLDSEINGTIDWHY